MIKTVNDLKTEIDILIDNGYGEIPLYLNAFNGEQGESYIIDSIQKNTNPEIKPDYFFFMESDEVANSLTHH